MNTDPFPGSEYPSTMADVRRLDEPAYRNLLAGLIGAITVSAAAAGWGAHAGWPWPLLALTTAGPAGSLARLALHGPLTRRSDDAEQRIVTALATNWWAWHHPWRGARELGAATGLRPACLYRALGRLETAGTIQADWDTSDHDLPLRVYRLTSWTREAAASRPGTAPGGES